MGQVTAVSEVHAENGIAGLKEREVNGCVCLCAAMGLYVCVFSAEKLTSAFASDLFYDVNTFATTVVTLGGIAFCIFISENAAHCCHNGFGNEVFGSDQLDAASLTSELLAHCFTDFFIIFGNEFNVLIYHENHPFFISSLRKAY